MTEEQKALVLENMRLIYYMANKYRDRGYTRYIEYEDLVGYASVAIVQAAISYKQDVGSSFANYACKCIANEIARAMSRARDRRKGYVHISIDYVVDKEGKKKTHEVTRWLVFDEDYTLAEVLTDLERIPEDARMVVVDYVRGYRKSEACRRAGWSRRKWSDYVRKYVEAVWGKEEET